MKYHSIQTTGKCKLTGKVFVGDVGIFETPGGIDDALAIAIKLNDFKTCGKAGKEDYEATMEIVIKRIDRKPLESEIIRLIEE